MESPICRKVVSMLSLYIDDKLDDGEKYFVETHLLNCSECYKKYLEMKEIISNLHFEYEKLINEFDCVESNKTFNIREYEAFYNNISPYIDDELCYDDSIKFRKYLLKSKYARSELAEAYGLKNNIRDSVSNFKDKVNVNFSRKVLKRLIDENGESFEKIYKKAAVLICFMIYALIVISLIVGFSYKDKSFAAELPSSVSENLNFPNSNDVIEFTFDENGELIMLAK